MRDGAVQCGDKCQHNSKVSTTVVWEALNMAAAWRDPNIIAIKNRLSFISLQY